MMLLRFQDPAKLKTKRIVFEDVFPAHDSGTLEQLKELSSRRRVIEESTNESRVITEAIAREMAGGLTSRNQQYLQKLELYLPLLENLVAHVHPHCNNSILRKWISGLNIRWSSVLGESPVNFGSPKFFRIDDLRFELGMTLFLYGAVLRESAFELLSEDLVESTTLYRKAAGVYNYVATEVLLPLQPSLAIERPLEVTSSMSSVMSLMCLAEAQAVTIKKAEERKASSKLLAKLHFGVTQTLDEAYSLMETLGRERNVVLARVVQEFISSSRFLHQLRSQRHLAEELASGDKVETAAGQHGISVGVLRYAVDNAKRMKAPRNETWRSVFNQEMVDAAEMLRKLEYENECVHHDKIPSVDGLPVLEGLRIVQAIPYEPQRWERQLCFHGVNN